MAPVRAGAARARPRLELPSGQARRRRRARLRPRARRRAPTSPWSCGWSATGPSARPSRRWRTRWGSRPQVHFLGERVDFPDVLRGADVFLLPSETESFGLAALEALACGVPVVASRVGGLPEVVLDGETGLLCPVGDVAAMADAGLAPAHRRRPRPPDGPRRPPPRRDRFRPDAAVDRYLDVYRRVLAGDPDRG